MSFASDDLAQLFAAPDREHTGYGQGILAAWDPETFSNQVAYRGTTLTNLPVLPGVDALSWQPGDVVLLMRWTPSGGGLSSYWLAGRPVIPGAGRAEQAIAFMSSNLVSALLDEFVSQLLTSPAGQTLMRAAITNGIRASVNNGQTTTSSTTFGDGTNAGPEVTDVVVSDLGLCLVLWGASIDAGPVASGQVAGHMGIQVSGATSIAATTSRSASVGQAVTVTGGGTLSHRAQARVMAADVLTLDPGTHTITGRYASGVAGVNAAFTNRVIIAIAF